MPFLALPQVPKGPGIASTHDPGQTLEAPRAGAPHRMKRSRKRPTRPVVRGDRVRQLREERNWTQQDLAARWGATVAEVSRVENAHRDMLASRLVDLAVALGVQTDFLVGLSDAADRVLVTKKRRK